MGVVVFVGTAVWVVVSEAVSIGFGVVVFVVVGAGLYTGSIDFGVQAVHTRQIMINENQILLITSTLKGLFIKSSRASNIFYFISLSQ